MARSFLRQILDKADLLLSGKERFARRKGVSIGRDCRILSNIVTTEPWLITVGDRVTISSEVTFITHDGSGWLIRDDRGRRYRYAPITLGSDVFITWVESEDDVAQIELDRLVGAIPAVAEGHFYAEADKATAMASTNPTPLSIPVIVSDFVPNVVEAIEGA